MACVLGALAASAPELFLRLLRALADPRDVLHVCATARAMQRYAYDHQTWTQLFVHWRKHSAAALVGDPVPPITMGFEERKRCFVEQYYRARGAAVDVASVFNAEYVCKISRVLLTHRPATDAGGSASIEVAVTFCVQGDGSLGDLQLPRHSKLLAHVENRGQHQIHSYMLLSGPIVALVESNRSSCFRGTLTYTLPTSTFAALQPGEELAMNFQYGADGYSDAPLLAFAVRPQQVRDSPPDIDPSILILPAHPAYVCVPVAQPAATPRYHFQAHQP